MWFALKCSSYPMLSSSHSPGIAGDKNEFQGQPGVEVSHTT